MLRPTRRPAAVFLLLPVLLLAACEVSPGGGAAATKQDTATVAATVPPGATLPGGDVSGVPAVPSDSTARAGLADTGTVELHPAQPRRGGVLFAFARGIAAPSPRCAWKGEPLPCFRHGDGVVAVVPLPADEAAGTFTLTFERPQGRIARTIRVQEHDFGRELVFLDKTAYALAGDADVIARDGRAIRGVLRGASPDRRWTGRWREPLASGAKSGGYGVERFYFLASDSTRAISLGTDARAGGSFGADTGGRAAPKGQGPAWRHAGVDYAAARGASVRAPANGVVAGVGDYGLTGRTLLVDHGHGVFSAFFHLDTIVVKAGEVVRANGVMARVGSTGLSTGPHLHHGVYVHGRDVDPAAWRDMPAWMLDPAKVAPPAAAGAAPRDSVRSPRT